MYTISRDREWTGGAMTSAIERKIMLRGRHMKRRLKEVKDLAGIEPGESFKLDFPEIWRLQGGSAGEGERHV